MYFGGERRWLSGLSRVCICLFKIHVFLRFSLLLFFFILQFQIILQHLFFLTQFYPQTRKQFFFCCCCCCKHEKEFWEEHGEQIKVCVCVFFNFFIGLGCCVSLIFVKFFVTLLLLFPSLRAGISHYKKPPLLQKKGVKKKWYKKKKKNNNPPPLLFLLNKNNNVMKRLRDQRNSHTLRS